MTNIRYTNRQTIADGSITEYSIVDANGRFDLITIRPGGFQETRKLGEFAGGLFDALQVEPALLTVGTGFTDITIPDDANLHEYLGLLVVAEPAAAEPDMDSWLMEDGSFRGDVDIEPEDWLYASDQIAGMRTAPGFTVVPRWIRINGQRGFVLRGDAFAAVGLANEDAEWERPDATQDILAWGFYRESGGPCSFDGGAELGWCGSKLWVFNRWGDFDPEVLVYRAPDPDGIAREIAAIVEELGWHAPYLITAAGLPGLSTEERETLWSMPDVEGQTVSSYTGEQLDNEVVRLLSSWHPELSEAVDGLRHPDCQRGQLIYAWVRQIIHGPYQSASWDQVHEAMFGRIDPPADDQRAPTSEERIKAQIARVLTLVEQQPSDE